MISMKAVLLIAALVTMEIIAESLLKKAAKDGNAITSSPIIISTVMYITMPFLIYTLFKEAKNLTVANTIWQVTNLIFVAVIGYFVFKDILNKRQLLGLALACIAAFMMMGNE